MGDLKKEVAARLSGLGKPAEETIDGVAKQAEDMSVIDKTMETARKLSGADVLGQQVKDKDKKMEEMQKDKEKKEQELQDARIQIVEKELGSKIDRLADAVKDGASTKSIGDQISDIKKTANELGLGSSKISEVKEIFEFIKSFSPQQKNLGEQLKEAKELIAALQGEKPRDTMLGEMPASIALELKKMDHNLQITLEEMKDARQRRDQEFALTLRKFDEDQRLKAEEIQGKVQVEREKTELIAGAIQTLGRSIGKGYAEATQGAPAAPGSISQQQPGKRQAYFINVAPGEFGQVECPYCKTAMGIGSDSTQAECVECKAQFPIVRTRAAQAETPAPGAESPAAEI